MSFAYRNCVAHYYIVLVIIAISQNCYEIEFHLTPTLATQFPRN